MGQCRKWELEMASLVLIEAALVAFLLLSCYSVVRK